MSNKNRIVFIFLAAIFLFWSCDHGQLGGADKTDTYYPTDALFKERLEFLCGTWVSSYDGYRTCKWGDFSTEDKARAQALFPDINLNANNPKTYLKQDFPQAGDYIVLFDDDTAGSGWGGDFCFMGLVRAINIFYGDKKHGAVIIEYFEKADPLWLSDADGFAYQGLTRGEKPFYGIYYRVIDSDAVQMANPIDIAALLAEEFYYTEKGTLNEAIKTFTVENEMEFVSWATASVQNREK
jgi:hypothetical protein